MDPPKAEEVHQKKDKTYIESKKKWKDFDLDDEIIDALREQNKPKPTKVQADALQIALDKDRKKFNLLIRAINGSGKTLAFLLPIINFIEPGLKVAEDKTFRGKLQHNQIFRPQGVIIIQNFVLQSQLNDYLINFKDYFANHNVDKHKFSVGVLNNDGHTHGDIIVCMPKSFLNRHSRGNMKLDQCKFVAIDQIDEIYNMDKDSLEQILKIVRDEKSTNLIACSATMEKHFVNFYQGVDKEYIRLNVNQEIEKETGQKVTLEGVKNYSKVIETKQADSKAEFYDFVLKQVFKELYSSKQENKKPQVFVFFNSVEDINEFNKKFEAYASDFTSQESEYLKNISKASIAAKKYVEGKKQDMPHSEKQNIIRKFRNGETNVLMCTNIMARGIDIRNAVFVINIGAPRQGGRGEAEIDVDTYLHRVGRTGRHNDKGLALTIDRAGEIAKLTEGVKKIHKIEIETMGSPAEITKEVYECITSNA